MGPNLAEKFTVPWVLKGKQVASEIQNIVTNANEFMELCKDIDLYKSSAIDNLLARVLKDAFMAIPNVMSTFFNLSLLQGTYPNKWKIAKIVPLFKGGEKTLVKNYRLVSLLPLPGKL